MVNKLLSGRRVLVIEDELLVLMMIEDMLADLGCESVVAAATVEKALAALDAEVIDVAMLDMNLNGDKSPAVAEALAARGIPFVYSTGDGGSNIGDGFRDRPVLRKPFRTEDLVEILTRLLSR